MPKIMIMEYKQEVSTFNPFLSQYDDFDISTGTEILEFHRNGQLEVAGALSVFDARPDVDLIPVYSARSITSGGTLSADGFTRIANECVEQLRNAPPVDAVYVAVHGAMAAENELDPEGFLLTEARKIVGEDVPIVISLDLHGILTERMIQQVNAFTAFHTYPHVDFYDTGVRAAHLLLKILDDHIQPVIARVAMPTLVRGDELITETGLFGQSIQTAKTLIQSGIALTAGLFIGNPFTDVPELQSYTYVITDNDEQTAEKEAIALANDFWKVRAQLQANDLITLAEAVQIALETTEGTIIFTDAADATSSGASGDSNSMLHALVKADYPYPALIPIVDANAAKVAFDIGVGGVVQTTVGGQLDSRFEPFPIEATVKMLSDGEFINESHGSMWHGGQTAVLEYNNYTLIVTSRAVSLYDRSLFLAHGQNPRNFNLVVVKSPHCQPQFFDDWAVQNLNVDAPGSTSANLKSLGHTICPRPIYPLDDNFDYQPTVQIFSRA
jgi:microcystin degradation protein MlrC